MLKVECESCKAPYQVEERRVPPAGLKMRCSKCGHSFLVHADSPAPAPSAPKVGTVTAGAVVPPVVPGSPGVPGAPSQTGPGARPGGGARNLKSTMMGV